jgi:predicted RNA-binding protein with PIN domain
MSVPFLIIDGYNVMHAAGLARATYGPGDLARKRFELLVKLARRLTIEERKRCTVVFDAIDAPKYLSGRFRHEEMLVLFAEPGHEADELIEILICEHSAPRRLTVVSSDHRLQNAIRKRRGTAVDSDVFLIKVESPHRQIGSSQPLGTTTTDPNKDLDFWLREFEGIDPESLNRELVVQSGESKSDWEQQVDQLQQQLLDSRGLDDWLNESEGRKPPPKTKAT